MPVFEGPQVQDPEIGLALSGGGYRAAAFHLGVFRKLNELGLLANVRIISSVSGGSILAAYYLLYHQNFQAFDDGISKFLTEVTIDTSAVWKGRLNPFKSTFSYLVNAYDKNLYANTPLKGLADSPQLVINATDLATGHLWKF